MSVEQKIQVVELTDEERAAQIDALLNSEPLPMIQKSIDAFRRDLPELLKTHYRKWVAYHGDERIGFGKTGTIARHSSCTSVESGRAPAVF